MSVSTQPGQIAFTWTLPPASSAASDLTRPSSPAFDALYAGSFKRLVAQIYAMCGNFAEAQDCVQEAFAAAWTAVEVWRSGWPLGGMPWGRLAFGVVDTPVAESLPYAGAVGVTFLLAPDGEIAKVYPEVSPETHADEILQDASTLEGS